MTNHATVNVDPTLPVSHHCDHPQHGLVTFNIGNPLVDDVTVHVRGTHAELLDFADRFKAAVLADLDRVTAPVVVEVDRRRPEAPTLPVSA